MGKHLSLALAIVGAALNLAQASPAPGWRAATEETAHRGLVGSGVAGTLVSRVDGKDPLRSVDGGLSWQRFDVLGRRPERFVSSPTDGAALYSLTGGVLRMSLTPSPSELHRSSDGGATWQLIADRLMGPRGEVLNKLVVGATPDLIYGHRMEATQCFTGSCAFDGVEGFRSDDGGRSWRSIDGGLGMTAFYPSPSNSRVVYGLSYPRTLYRSDDQGENWIRLRVFDDYMPLRSVVVDARDPLILYVHEGTWTRVWVSEDGGATWRRSPDLNVPGPNRHLVADPVHEGRVYFIGHQGEVFESLDRARSWHRVAPPSGAEVMLPGYAGSPVDPTPVVAVSGETRRFTTVGEGKVRQVALPEGSLFLGSDLWWNPAESGAGFSITQHPSGKLFMVWYSYDVAGKSQWLVMSDGTWSGNTYTGALYLARGPDYFAGAFDPSRVSLANAGSATLRLEGDSDATFLYEFVDGTHGVKRITRQLYGPPAPDYLAPQVANHADLWWNTAEPGWGLAASQQFRTMFATWFVYGSDDKPLWVVMPAGTYDETPVGNRYAARFRGDLYVTEGPPSGEAFDPGRVKVTRVGSASLLFMNSVFYGVSDELTLIYEAFGRSETRRLTRQPF